MRACVCGCECFHCVRFRRVKEKDCVVVGGGGAEAGDWAFIQCCYNNMP